MGNNITPEQLDNLSLLFGGKLPSDDPSVTGLPAGMPANYGVTDGFGKAAPKWGPVSPAKALYGPIAAGPSAAQPVASPSPSPAPIKQPSDDPSITDIALPTPPQFQTGGHLDRMAKLQQQIAVASKPVDYQANKPKWYDRLMGAGVGFAAGWGDPARGAELGGNVTNRRMITAEGNRKRNLDPLLQQMQSERDMLPEYQEQNRITQDQFNNSLNISKEKREQAQAQGKDTYYQGKLDTLKDKFIAGSEMKDPNSPTGWTAETGDGSRKPFTPKNTMAQHKEPKNADEALSAASSEDDPKEKGRLIKLAHDLHKQEVDRVREGRPQPNADPSGYTPAEQREITSNTTQYKNRIAALEKERALWTSEDDDSGKKKVAAIDAELSDLYKKTKDVEDSVIGRRGTGQGTKASSSRTAEGVPHSVFKGQEGKRVRVKGKNGKTLTYDVDGKGVPTLAKSTQ